MQAVILAAGTGTRFWPISETKPKPLFTLLGKTILEHNLEQLNGLVSSVIIIIGYKGDDIRKKIGDRYLGMEILYVEQKEVNGTGGAAKSAYNLMEDKFVLLNGDDFYSGKDIKKAIEKFPSILLKSHTNPSSFGVVLAEEGFAKELAEKPDNPISNLVNTGLYCLPKKIFGFEIQKSVRGEYEFTDYIKKFIKQEKLKAVVADFWIPASHPWDTFSALPELFKREKEERKGKIEKGAVLKGQVIVKEGTIIKAGSYIEGPAYIGKNCTIGPNCFLRDHAVIEDECRIGQAVEIKNSIISKKTNVSHLSYVGDSIIGENSNVGAGTITTNLKHDGENIKTMVKGDLVDTSRVKLGTITGDNVKTGANTIIYPGRKIGANKNTLPGDKVEKDII
jgi:bifunctional UDP-N-acetylglucosamine pyrophosphorylase/glucosamine-1-phosphate N-acetyltransferase